VLLQGRQADIPNTDVTYDLDRALELSEDAAPGECRLEREILVAIDRALQTFETEVPGDRVCFFGRCSDRDQFGGVEIGVEE
jgi:hypothetical protein